MTVKNDRFAATLEVNGAAYTYYPVAGVPGSERLPYALTVLLENVLRNAEDSEAAEKLAGRIVAAGNAGEVGSEVEFCPARVLFQDFTGVPVFVDFAVMREACAQLGGDPAKINPQIPCDLVIDHSVIADEAGCAGALERNMELEFERNRERYDFLKWAQESFDNVRIVPPGAGICHQLNIEQFARVVMTSYAAGVAVAEGEAPVAYFDTLVGTDSHTPTANGIGVLGWGVGGIEAEAAALGQPITTLVPRVVGVKLTGRLSEGVAAMEARKGDLHGLVNLGMIFTVQDDYLPALLRAYQAEFGSNVSIEIHQAFTNYLTQNLHNETLDLAFCGKRENEPDIAYFPVLNRPLELCVRSGHPLSRRSSVTFDDLRGMRLITYRRGIPIGEQVEKLLEEAALEGVVQNYDDDISMASVISIDGGTGALMLNSVGIKLFSDITMIPIEGVPRDFYWVYLACSKKHYKSGAVRSFIDFVKRFDSDDVDFGHWPEGRPVSTS